MGVGVHGDEELVGARGVEEGVQRERHLRGSAASSAVSPTATLTATTTYGRPAHPEGLNPDQ
ncbi:hypothetical protein ACIBHX_44455 [Nonomuraea sp. NPDC050536]|uniref:hypothetical protein n=1 Tax=Nonomuraea sp. NPDC050536 TaxID=3364366 RepID=UPI0037C70D25